jgi:hypothetical protein
MHTHTYQEYAVKGEYMGDPLWSLDGLPEDELTAKFNEALQVFYRRYPKKWTTSSAKQVAVLPYRVDKRPLQFVTFHNIAVCQHVDDDSDDDDDDDDDDDHDVDMVNLVDSPLASEKGTITDRRRTQPTRGRPKKEIPDVGFLQVSHKHKVGNHIIEPGCLCFWGPRLGEEIIQQVVAVGNSPLFPYISS